MASLRLLPLALTAAITAVGLQAHADEGSAFDGDAGAADSKDRGTIDGRSAVIGVTVDRELARLLPLWEPTINGAPMGSAEVAVERAPLVRVGLEPDRGDRSGQREGKKPQGRHGERSFRAPPGLYQRCRGDWEGLIERTASAAYAPAPLAAGAARGGSCGMAARTPTGLSSAQLSSSSSTTSSCRTTSSFD